MLLWYFDLHNKNKSIHVYVGINCVEVAVRDIFVTLVEDETTIVKGYSALFSFPLLMSNCLILFNTCTYSVYDVVTSRSLFSSFSPVLPYGSDSYCWIDVVSKAKVTIFNCRPIMIDNNKLLIFIQENIFYEIVNQIRILYC